MQKNYAHLDIPFLPDRILKDISQNPQLTKPLAENLAHGSDLSTNLISSIALESNQFLNFLLETQVDSIFEDIHKYIT